MAIYPASGGALSPYLVGVWQTGLVTSTTISLVNPTSHPLEYRAVFFNAECKSVGCVQGTIGPNCLAKIDAKQFGNGEGAVKIVSHKAEDPTAGLVGYQRKTESISSWFTTRYTATEAPLFQLPYDEVEWKILKGVCQK